jgi:hypothetical protein
LLSSWTLARERERESLCREGRETELGELGGVVGVVGVDWTTGLGAGGAEEMRMVAVAAGKEGRR